MSPNRSIWRVKSARLRMQADLPRLQSEFHHLWRRKLPFDEYRDRYSTLNPVTVKLKGVPTKGAAASPL